MDVYASLAGAGLTVSFFHAILPNHWLPFVLAGRAQRWSLGRTLSIVGAAGLGHVLITTALGLLIVWAGMAVASFVEEWSALLAMGVLILFGLFYIVRDLRGKGHSHLHIPGLPHLEHPHGHEHSHSHDEAVCEGHGHDDHGGHAHPHADDEISGHGHDRAHGHEHGGNSHGAEVQPRDGRSGDVVAVGSLIAMLTFSPCEGFLPIYLSAWPHGWAAFLLLSGVLAAGTLLGMVVFTGLAFAGVARLELPWLEKHEGLLVGGVLILLGLAVLLLHE